MKKKNLILIAMLLVASMLLVACGGGKDNSETGTDVAGGKVEDKGDALNIAIVSSPSGVDDGSFNQDNYEGILAFIENHPDAKVTPIQEPTGDPAAGVKQVSDIVADYDVIVACGYQFAGIGAVAEENPDTKFILVDSYPTNASGEEVELENVYAMQFAEQESGFYAGVAAALETKTGKIAVVNGIAFPSNVNYQFGFEAGVNYAVKHLDAKAEIIELPSYAGEDVNKNNVGGNYIGDFNDEATGKVVGNALIDQDVDIMFVAAGNSGNGVFTAAKEADDIKVIGCDVDQFDDGKSGDKNIVITSGLKIMGMNVEKQLENMAAGKFKGENALLKADTDSTGYVKEEGRHQLSEKTLEELEKVYTAVKEGKIVPPSNFSETTPEDFEGLE
ncbi:BMP family lipoprotein [Miniphocaeibacter halophilus]|uniref:BMP family ABC transporter substrate-binding protein n=1 Tax=Miniphocaeibacter halophilus TaxID=2931922 RepID=A0AC61MRZ2_9FIRM|nr:BMP family ABC transporter substrate-binding protein [Miniphocaeibacter halophilus]QQK07219.1 BMP family ABC transporter substrate-binding protein [Miniphocaeibacter halophilus]